MATEFASTLDGEITNLEAKVQSLETRRTLLSTALLNNPNTLTRLQNAKDALPKSQQQQAVIAIDLAEKQALHTLTNAHRLCAGATSFLVHDPDPAAAANGNRNVLGVRIDVPVVTFHKRRDENKDSSTSSSSIQPYHLFLNQSLPSVATITNSPLRIHRHTIPPFIPLLDLSRRFLPQPSSSPSSDDNNNSSSSLLDADAAQPKQDLAALVRALRQLLVSHHKRLDAIAVADARAASFYRRRAEAAMGVGDSGRARSARDKSKLQRVEGRTRIWAGDKAGMVVELWFEDDERSRATSTSRGEEGEGDLYDFSDEGEGDGETNQAMMGGARRGPGLTGTLRLSADGGIAKALVRRVDGQGVIGERVHILETAMRGEEVSTTGTGSEGIEELWERVEPVLEQALRTRM